MGLPASMDLAKGIAVLGRGYHRDWMMTCNNYRFWLAGSYKRNCYFITWWYNLCVFLESDLVDWCAIHHGNLTAQGRRAHRLGHNSPKTMWIGNICPDAKWPNFSQKTFHQIVWEKSLLLAFGKKTQRRRICLPRVATGNTSTRSAAVKYATFQDQNCRVKLTILETYQIALKSFWSVRLVFTKAVSSRGSSTRWTVQVSVCQINSNFIHSITVFYIATDYKINSHKTRDLL